MCQMDNNLANTILKEETKTWLDNIKDWSGLKFEQLPITAEGRKTETLCE